MNSLFSRSAHFEPVVSPFPPMPCKTMTIGKGVSEVSGWYIAYEYSLPLFLNFSPVWNPRFSLAGTLRWRRRALMDSWETLFKRCNIFTSTSESVVDKNRSTSSLRSRLSWTRSTPAEQETSNIRNKMGSFITTTVSKIKNIVKFLQPPKRLILLDFYAPLG